MYSIGYVRYVSPPTTGRLSQLAHEVGRIPHRTRESSLAKSISPGGWRYAADISLFGLYAQEFSQRRQFEWFFKPNAPARGMLGTAWLRYGPDDRNANIERTGVGFDNVSPMVGKIVRDDDRFSRVCIQQCPSRADRVRRYDPEHVAEVGCDRPTR
jgi:hypothetical protein